MPSQTIRSQHTTLSRILSAKKGSIIPQLSIDPFCSLDDIPARPKEIMSEIAAIFQQLTKLELEGSKLVLLVKTRATWDMCSMENDVLTRQSTPEDALRTINYHRKHSKQRFVLIVFLLSEVFKMLANGSCCTKRELYYRDPQLTVHQRCVDDALQDVCFLLKADLWELNVFSSSKGLIAGQIKFHSKHEEMIDCCNSFGTQIPADVNGLLEVEVDAELILIVEKDTVFRRLLDDGVLTRLSRKIIIVTSKGYPDVGTRLLLKKIWDKCRIPMYALVDADPFGVEIYCVYKFGSLALSHQASQLAVPQIQWLGLKPSHTTLLDLKLLPLTPRDQSRIRELLRRPYIGQRGCLLERELNLMRELNGKAEIESLTDISVDYLLNEYLPNQLQLIST
nr:meiotic recombination protein SPO11-like [Aedes albopictus]